ncbi:MULTISPECIES: phosphopantetheine-binding protein [Pseudoflavonifractor]|uniref:Acyl carrier protein n=1 Tax=Candidatus Enterenecus faecium TaxID=2840780 RepID=A0A9D1CI28_9FIRM|nr:MULTISPECIES: phosphopantetheine-binding protein [Pseudoflavonifractor]HIQ61923.1 acyl carrier protein [Candidatus Enterenecus faecium]MBM6694648.1 acyl carrier protein [Pseudoflavonifractor capillosus]NJE73182.1 acyl carrier protein [Pseudoflavonifractor sp. SW1122]OUN96088.1 acyl carrier protein [Pseudoflavonifractor sp. An44]OUP46343.1 acyl carrier protein [Pseudoflavonifractor sp. An187]
MEQLLEILEEIRPDLDFANCQDLIDGHHLNSLDIISIVAELEDAFDITVPTVEVIPHNFNSAQNLWAMIQRLQEEG